MTNQKISTKKLKAIAIDAIATIVADIESINSTGIFFLIL